LSPLWIGAVLEGAWIYNLGAGKKIYSYNSTGSLATTTVTYPNVMPFVLTLVVLLSLSLGTAVFAAASLRSPGTAVLGRAFGLNRRGARFLFVGAVVNSLLVVIVALVALSASALNFL
jgi:hypothetical protein